MPRPYSADFKERAVALARLRYKPVAQIAHDLGIPHGCLQAWVEEADISDRHGRPSIRTRDRTAGSKSVEDAPLDATATVNGWTLARRQAWGVADQAIFSATSFACAIAIGRTGDTRAFGAFAAAYLLYVLVLGTTEAFTAEVMVVRASSGSDAYRTKVLRGAAACAFIAGIPVAAMGFVALIAMSGPLGSMAPPILLLAPLLFLQDIWRHGFFLMNRPRAAVVNDLIWGIAQTASFAILARTGAPASAYIWAWSGAGALAAVIGSLQISLLPAPREAAEWVREHGALGRRFAAEYLALFGAAQSVLALVGASAGLAAAGGYRGGQLIYGPLQVALNAVRLSVTPLLARARQTGWGHVGRAAVRLGMASSVVAGLWCLAVLHIPARAGEAVLGDSWLEARRVLVPMGVTTIALGVNLAALIVLRVAEAVDRSLPVRLTVAGLTLSFGAAGAIINGASGGAIGVSVAQSCGAVALSWHAYRELQLRQLSNA